MSMDLTEDERARLINPNGERDGSPEWYDDVDPDCEYVTCHRCGYEWEYQGQARRADCPVCKAKTRRNNAPSHEDYRGLSTPMCNAIREAAHDGLTYEAIAGIFNFIATRSTAHRHATGRCSHGDGDVPPVGDRDPSQHPNVTPAECTRLRRQWLRGEYRTTADAADDHDRHKSTIIKHLRGGCKHDRPEDEQRRIDERIEQNREASFFTADNPWAGGIADD